MGTIGKAGLCAVAALAVMLGGAAFGQVQSGGQQKCINTLNKDIAKVAATAGKNNAACVKSAAKGMASATCVSNDGSGKLAPVEAKAASDESSNGCVDANEPGFGYGGVDAGTTAAVVAEVNLFADTYGTTDTTGVISTAKADAKCQATVTKDLEKLIATKWKQYLSCKKATLTAGATDEAALEACLSGDPNSIAADSKGKINKALTKLDSDIGKDCSALNISMDFPGICSGATTGTLANCLDTSAKCRICQAINATDDVSEECDLFDDGVENNSCLPPFQPVGQLVGGSLWYLGIGGQSCDQVCASVGKVYSSATQTFAGDLGTDANCQAVLNALGVDGPLSFPSWACDLGVGCEYETTITIGPKRCMSPATTPTVGHSTVHRACACQ